MLSVFSILKVCILMFDQQWLENVLTSHDRFKKNLQQLGQDWHKIRPAKNLSMDGEEVLSQCHPYWKS